ncbi:Rv0518 family GDSL lipase [Mycobacterium sp. IDR2000157661]|uniref:Rv0518 family GDSL lipase n=1 Tax=Mycobacterium sp. IDR2000157661 TaxID=2867005 RepID=UPI001EEB4579|nr:GDSL lipase [Mycobacterium sp. IDR2000157661]ULE32320.1 SGNH/GDSL hydrolase family protein [Mycobacterium sp. IDR2000157661]
MKRVVTALVALSLMVVVGCQRPDPAGHEQVVALTFSANRVAVIGDSYTTGGGEGGLGEKSWPAQAWQILARQGVATAADIGAEGGAGYGIRGNRGRLFEDLTAATVKPDDRLVVFFGSRNDLPVDPTQLSILAYGTFTLARRIAPAARFVVIGPPWPTADPPPALLRIRDTLEYQAGLADATFVDPLAERWFVGMPQLIGADGVHPTDAGHAYMAAKIAPLIAAHLPRRT